MKARKLGSIGDINPIEYGGGYILSAPEMGGPWIEYFEGLDCESTAWQIELDNPEHLKREVTVYRVDLEKDGKQFLSSYDWVVWHDVAESCGNSEQYVRAIDGAMRTTLDVTVRASMVQDAAGYYGWHAFDSEPLTLTLGELIERWKEY